MLTRMVSSGLLAGVIAGLCVTVIETRTTVPLILEAERYETARHDHAWGDAVDEARVVLAHSHGTSGAHPEFAQAPGVQRIAFSAVATIGAAVGFALMLLAVMLASGAGITARSGALWGAAGFVAAGLAPAFGLAPALPGSAEIDLVSRQLWWIATATATAAGLWGLWRWRTAGPVIACLALISLPHLAGAPGEHQYASMVPAELAAHFTATSLAVQAILWGLVGALSGAAWGWLEPGNPSARSPA